VDNETALAFYQQAVVLDPDFSLAHAGMANAYALRTSMYGAGDEWAEKSIRQAKLALSINPVLPEAYKALGITSFHYGHYQESLNYYLKAIELNPGYDEALFNIAEIYQQQGQWDEAVRYQMRDSERAFGAERLSIYLRDLQFHDEADKLRERTSAEIPISFLTEDSLSLKYLLAGDFEQALNWYEQAVDAGRRRYEWDEQESGFASLHDEPGFQAALEKQRQLREEMRARVNVMLHEQ